jgi:hypothetical protein
MSLWVYWYYQLPIMALIQLDLGVVDQPDLEVKKSNSLYDTKIQLTKWNGTKTWERHWQLLCHGRAVNQG